MPRILPRTTKILIQMIHQLEREICHNGVYVEIVFQWRIPKNKNAALSENVSHRTSYSITFVLIEMSWRLQLKLDAICVPMILILVQIVFEKHHIANIFCGDMGAWEKAIDEFALHV